MLFNSIDYLIFLTILFLGYWHLIPKKENYQNSLLLLASIFFYGYWDIRFLLMLFSIISIDYFFGIQIAKNTGKKALIYLVFCLINNIGILLFFKYTNFFIELTNLFLNNEYSLINLIIPIGISFYTFHGISYVLDIYKKKINPEKNFIRYSLFVSYFPLLVAGPIERATHLLPQLKEKRIFNHENATNGVKLIIYGLFKKVVIADTIALYVNPTFEEFGNYTAYSLLLAAIGFSIQIYCDFSGYSDIAIGTSKLFNIELLSNFKFPYFATSIKDFWKRWHISLTSWFRDYVYIPIGGSKVKKLIKIRNVFYVFIISAFWHGGNFTFIYWGIIHFCFYVLEDLLTKSTIINKLIKVTPQLFKRTYTFVIVTIAWVFFRSKSIKDALHFLKQILLNSYENPENFSEHTPNKPILYYTIGFLLIDWLFRKNERSFPNYFKYIGIIMVNLIIFYYLSQSEESFIYFQF